MADKSISQVPTASALAGTETVPVVQSSTTKKTTVADIAGLNLGSRTWGNIYAGGGLNASGITDGFTYLYGTPDGTGYEFARVQATRDTEDGWTYGSALCFYTEGKNSGATDTSTNKGRFTANGHFRPEGDNTQSLGKSTKRWSVVYAGTGTINTSDAREKTAVNSLTKQELTAAKQLAKEIGSFQFLDSVAVKGSQARLHIGMTVQRAIEIMLSNGLDPMAYAFICHDAWDALYEDVVEVIKDGDQIVNVQKTGEKRLVREAGDRFGFRPEQLALFILRGMEERLSALEA